MQPLPPPPPPRPDMPSWPESAPLPARPQQVTAAGVILIVLGAIQGLAGVVFMVVSPADLSRIGSIGDMDLGPVARGIGLFSFVVGALEIFAGMLVLRRSDAGRIFAIILSSLGAFGGAASVLRGSAPGVLTLGLYAYVIYVMVAHRASFRGTRAG